MIDDRKHRDYYLKVERTAEQQRRDLVTAFDQIYDLKCKMRGLKLKLWVLSGAGALAISLAGWLGNALLSCLQAAK